MSEEGFLGRWSRRKRATLRGAPPEPPAQAAPPDPPAPAAAPDAPVFDPASLPPLDSLTAESDFTGFLRAEVPAALRQAALRRMWSLDPVIRDYVGPADYAWDFNAPDGMPGFALELGGDVRKLLAQAIGLPEDEPEAEPAEPEAPADPPGAEAPPPAIAQAPEAPPAPEPAPEVAPPSPPLTGRRRHGGALPA